MGYFYGNIKNNQKAPYIFDKIYPSRCAMEQAMMHDEDGNGAVQGDGIFINRFVLVDYGYNETSSPVQVQPSGVQVSGQPKENYLVNSDTYKYYYVFDGVSQQYVHPTVWQPRANANATTPAYYTMENYIDRWDSSLNENAYFASNRDKDRQRYYADYHLTAWLKIYVDNKERYVLVGNFNSQPPSFSLVIDAPVDGGTSGGPHFDLMESSDMAYALHMPSEWDMMLNEHNPNLTYSTSQNVDGYWKYEYNLPAAQRTYDSTHEYPYFNEAGFNERTQSHVSGTNTIKINDTKSGRKYPNHEWAPIQLTPDTYRPGQYYIKQGNEYVITSADYNKNATYYYKTAAKSSPTDSEQKDIKRLDIFFPAIGNAVSDTYDHIYGQPNSTHLIGYTTSSIANGYASGSTHRINSLSGTGKALTNAQIDALWHDNTFPHDVPVYVVANNVRPYTKAQIFNALNIEPYNNVSSSDPISMGWAVVEMKKYISELRYLSHGSTNSVGPTPGVGLQSDWSRNDNTSFGYIYNRPKVIYDDGTVPTPTNAHPGSDYTIETIQTLWDAAKNLT